MQLGIPARMDPTPGLQILYLYGAGWAIIWILDLFIFMQISTDQATTFVIIVTLVFLLAPLALFIFTREYNTRKKQHIDEKEHMQRVFKEEINKTRMEVKEHMLQTIGADLHDNIGQLLGLTNLTLSSIRLSDQEKAEQKIADSILLTKRSIKELRQLAHLINNTHLSASNLADAIEAELNWLEKTERYIIERTFDADLQNCNVDKDIIIFRLFQEILNNIIKHAEANTIRVSLSRNAGTLRLIVTDDGKGYDVQEMTENSGLGIKNMYKRAALIGAKADILSQDSIGTTIQINVSYP